MSAARLAAAEKRPDESFELPKRTAMALKQRHCDLGLMQEGNWRTVCCEGEAEIGNSGSELTSEESP